MGLNISPTTNMEPNQKTSCSSWWWRCESDLDVLMMCQSRSWEKCSNTGMAVCTTYVVQDFPDTITVGVVFMKSISFIIIYLLNQRMAFLFCSFLIPPPQVLISLFLPTLPGTFLLLHECVCVNAKLWSTKRRSPALPWTIWKLLPHDQGQEMV